MCMTIVHRLTCIAISTPMPRSFSTDTATTDIYTLSLHDALPISVAKSTERGALGSQASASAASPVRHGRSEEHTSELQSRRDLVCRLLLEKKKQLTHLLGVLPVHTLHAVDLTGDWQHYIV